MRRTHHMFPSVRWELKPSTELQQGDVILDNPDFNRSSYCGTVTLVTSNMVIVAWRKWEHEPTFSSFESRGPHVSYWRRVERN